MRLMLGLELWQRGWRSLGGWGCERRKEDREGGEGETCSVWNKGKRYIRCYVRGMQIVENISRHHSTYP